MSFLARNVRSARRSRPLENRGVPIHKRAEVDIRCVPNRVLPAGEGRPHHANVRLQHMAVRFHKRTIPLYCSVLNVGSPLKKV